MSTATDNERSEAGGWSAASCSPYFEDSHVTLYCGDVLEILPTLPDVEIVVTDPPYNVGIEYGAGVDDRRMDYEEWCEAWFTLCREKSKVQSIACGFPNVAAWVRRWEPKWYLAWHKPGAMGRSPMGFCNWEPQLIYGKPQTKKGLDVVVAPIIPDRAVNGHPCPKPLKWASGIITQLSESGTVLDPFAGSGTTLRAAKDLNRKAIGIEINEEYCEIIVSRLSQGILL